MSQNGKALTATRHLPVPLSDTRKRELTEELVSAINDKERMEESFALQSKKHKEIVKSRQLTINTNAQALSQGFDMLPVSCATSYDVLTNTMKVVRLDTGEAVETRAMTREERDSLIKGRKEASHGTV